MQKENDAMGKRKGQKSIKEGGLGNNRGDSKKFRFGAKKGSQNVSNINLWFIDKFQKKEKRMRVRGRKTKEKGEDIVGSCARGKKEYFL